VISERGGRGETTGETVEVHDSEGDGEVNVVDDGLSATVRSIGEANATRETHLSEIDGPDGDEYVCQDCDASFDCKQALGGHRKGCDGETPRIKNEDAGDTAAVSVELTRREAFDVIRSAPTETARRVFVSVVEEVSE